VVFTNTVKLPGPRNFRLFGTMQAAISPDGPWRDLARLSVPMPPPEEGQFFRTLLTFEEVPSSGFRVPGSRLRATGN
jgi:hypothetical protein